MKFLRHTISDFVFIPMNAGQPETLQVVLIRGMPSCRSPQARAARPAGASRAAGARTPAAAAQREAPALPGSPPRSRSIVTRRARPANGRAAARTAD